MRRDLAGHTHAARLPFAHGPERLPRAHVRDVDVRAGQLRERDVPLDHQRFRGSRYAAQPERRRAEALVRDSVSLQRGIFAVIDDRRPQHPGVFQGAPHQQRRGHRAAVVRKRDATCGTLFAELGELLATRPERHGTDRVDPRQPRLRRLLEDELRDAGVIVDRLGVRHAGNGGEPSGDCRRRARRDRLFVLLPRLAQVNVHVDQTGHDQRASSDLEHLCAVDREIPGHPSDTSVLDQHVERAVTVSGRVDYPSALEQQLHDTSYEDRGLAPGPLRPWRASFVMIPRPTLHRDRRAGRAPPCARQRRWPPAPESPSRDRPRPRNRSRRRGSWALDA